MIPDDIRYEYLETVLINRQVTYEFMKFAEEGVTYLKHLYEKGNNLLLNKDIESEHYMSKMNQDDKNIFKKIDAGSDTLSKIDLTLPASRAFRLKQYENVEKVALQAREILQKFQ